MNKRKNREVNWFGVTPAIRYLLTNSNGKKWTIEELETEVAKIAHCLPGSDSTVPNVEASLTYLLKPSNDKNGLDVKFSDDGKIWYEGDLPPIPKPSFGRTVKFRQPTHEPEAEKQQTVMPGDLFEFVGNNKQGKTLLRDNNRDLWVAERF